MEGEKRHRKAKKGHGWEGLVKMKWIALE